MSYLSFGKAILDQVLDRAGEKRTAAGTSDYQTVAKEHISRAIADIHMAGPFPWALKHPPGVISLVAKVTATVNSISGTTVTLSATIATSQAGKKFSLDSEQIVYRIATHTAGTAILTLDATYTETTTTGACTIFQDEYALATDVLRPWYGWFRNRPSDRLDFFSGAEANDRFPSRLGYTKNRTYKLALIQATTDDATNVRSQVRIIPWVEDAVTVEYTYSFRPPALDFSGAGAADTPFVPLENRHLIVERALFYLMVDKNDDRADGYKASSEEKMRQMIHLYFPMQHPRFVPRAGARIG